MAQLTGAELIEEVRKNFANRTDLLDDRILSLINIIQLRLVRAFDFTELQRIEIGSVSTEPKLTNGVHTYLFSTILSESNVRMVHEIRRIESDNQLIKELVIRRKDDSVPQPDYFANDVASHYIDLQSSIVVLNTPNVTEGLFIRYSIFPNDILVGTTSDFVNKDDLLIALVTNWIYYSLGNTDMAKEWLEISNAIFNSSVDYKSEAINLRHITQREEVMDDGRTS